MRKERANMLMHYETKRLNLDILTPDDCLEVLDFYVRNRAIFQPYDPIAPQHYYTKQYQYHSLACEQEMFLKQQQVRYYLTKKECPGRIIGTISFNQLNRGYINSAVIGYKLDRTNWHQGYAAEALKKGIEAMFYEEHYHRINAYIVPGNLPSIRLAERLAFSYEGIAREYAQIQGVWQDHLQYSLINHE